MNDDQRLAAYIRAVGHPPRNRPDDPDWNYTGTKEEVEELKRRLGLSEEPEVIEGQESLL